MAALRASRLVWLKVIGDQCPGKQLSFAGDDHIRQSIQKRLAVVIILEDRRPIDSADHHMVHYAEHVHSGSSWHAQSLAAPQPPSNTSRTFATSPSLPRKAGGAVSAGEWEAQ